MRTGACLLFLAAWAHGFEHYRIVREGAVWVRTDSGTISISRTARLSVSAPGKVQVQGEDRDDVGFVVKRRIRAKDARQARALLTANRLRALSTSQHVSLLLRSGAKDVGAPELLLRIPRRLPQSSVVVKNGTISVSDVDGIVSVENISGSIIADRVRAPLVARTGGGEIRLGRIGGAVRCISGGGGVSLESAAGETVIDTAGGEIFVREVYAPLTARTGGGNVQVIRAASSVNAFTGGGQIEVNQAGGVVTANTQAGGIQVGIASGARCESFSGPIQIYTVSGAVQATARQGAILAGLTGGVLRDSFLNAWSGDITVFLPSNLAVTVKAESADAGRLANIFSEFPEIRVLFGPMRPMQATGTINGGGPLLRLSAAGGSVHLKRQQ